MLVVGLTGGIGTGKTTFAALLAQRGAQVIDADLLGRDALRPGRPAWHSVVDQFGDEILAAGTMEIDRKRLAAIVFGDREKLAALNAIVHPVIFRGIADRLDSLRRTDEVVVLDVALLVETGLEQSVDVVVVVEAAERLRVDRLKRDRDMSPADIRARMDVQADPELLRAKADILVANTGGIGDLAREADRVWEELLKRNKSRT
jgi:dephospho-CoA kinase